MSQGYWRNRKRACLASTRYWDRNPDTPIEIRYGVVGNISACHADARGSIPRFGVFFVLITSHFIRGRNGVQTGGSPGTVRLSYGHTTVKTPHPIRTAKLSTVGPDQYFGRGLQGNLRCCMSFFFCAKQKVFYFFFFIFSRKKKKEGQNQKRSGEGDLNSRPMDGCACALYSPLLYR